MQCEMQSHPEFEFGSPNQFTTMLIVAPRAALVNTILFHSLLELKDTLVL